MASVAVDEFGVVAKTSKKEDVSLQQTINRIAPLEQWYRRSFPSKNFPTHDDDTFAIINTQPSKMQSEYWILIANFYQLFSFAVFSVLKVQFPQSALRTGDSRTTTVPSQRLLFLLDRCSISSLQIPTRRNYWRSGCLCTFIHK